MPRDSLDLSGRGSVYLRISGDKQEDGRQRLLIQQALEKAGVTVPPNRYYVDEGGARDLAGTAKRADFNRLMKDVDDKQLDWTLVDSQDRFGTKNEYQFISFIYRFQEANCRLLDVDGKDFTADDISTFVTSGIGANQSKIEQREKSKRVLGGKIKRALQGQWQGGLPAYGMDVVCFDLTGEIERWRLVIESRERGQPHTKENGRIVRPWNTMKVQFRADGTTQRFDGEGRTPPHEKLHEILQLRPSRETSRIEIVRKVFQWYRTEAINPTQIAARLDGLKVPSVNAPRWDDAQVRNMLGNPIYRGRQRYNQQKHARFYEYVGGERREVDRSAKRYKYRPSEEWVLSDELFEPIIDLKLWDDVQDKLAAEPKVTRSPRAATLWLAGMVYCSTCGLPMRGHMMRSGNGTIPVYICSSYSRKLPGNKCGRNAVHQTVLEGYVSEFVNDTADAMVATDTERLPHSVGEAMQTFAKAYVRFTTRARELSGDATLTPGQAIELYPEAFKAAEPKLRAELAGVKEEQTLAIRTLSRLPDSATSAIRDLQAQIAELDVKVRDLESRLMDADAEFVRETEAAVKLITDWAEATKAMGGDVADRTKSAALRRVIERINVSFKSTGNAYRSMTWDEIEVVPLQNYPDVTPSRRSGTCSTRTRRSG